MDMPVVFVVHCYRVCVYDCLCKVFHCHSEVELKKKEKAYKVYIIIYNMKLDQLCQKKLSMHWNIYEYETCIVCQQQQLSFM